VSTQRFTFCSFSSLFALSVTGSELYSIIIRLTRAPPLIYRAIQSIIHETFLRDISATSLLTFGYSGDSLRKGAAITAYANGISKHDI
jgi:hypothetical protein